MDNGIIEPRIRLNRTAPLNVTTTWQDVDFNGTSQANTNTFGKDPVSGNNMVWYNPTTKLFRFYEPYDTNYLIRLDFETTTNLLTLRATLQYRFVVPNGTSAGVDYYFPFSDGVGYADAYEVTVLATTMAHNSLVIPTFVENRIRNNGFKLQVRLSNSLVTLGTCTLNSSAILIY